MYDDEILREAVLRSQLRPNAAHVRIDVIIANGGKNFLNRSQKEVSFIVRDGVVQKIRFKILHIWSKSKPPPEIEESMDPQTVCCRNGIDQP